MKDWGVFDGIRHRWLTQPGQLTERQSKRVVAVLDPTRYVPGPQPILEIVTAPGDQCGNTRRLADGSPCPGCRACA